MKINNIAIGSIFVLGVSLFSSPAYAEEIIEEPAVIEEAASESSPEVMDDTRIYTQEEVANKSVVIENPAPSSYVPPAEASEGVGGWAVVNPDTGKVHGVIVGTIDTYRSVEARGGMGHSYMGCHERCVLRFQTRATSDGNVAGWHGDNVTYNGDSNKTFSITSRLDNNTLRVETLVPEQTAKDPAGMNLHTGIKNIRTRGKAISEGAEAIIESNRDGIEDSEGDVSILIPDWREQNKIFNYLSEQQAVDNFESDVDSELFLDGFTSEIELLDPETLEISTETIIDEENVFVKTIRQVTTSVIDFFSRIFGIEKTTQPVIEEPVIEEANDETVEEELAVQ